MEAKLQEILILVKDLTENKSLRWEEVQPGNQSILQSKVGHFGVQLTYSGPNVSFTLQDENGRPIAAHAESRTEKSQYSLFQLWKTASRQASGIDEKLNRALEELKKLKS